MLLEKTVLVISGLLAALCYFLFDIDPGFFTVALFCLLSSFMTSAVAIVRNRISTRAADTRRDSEDGAVAYP